MPRDLVLKESSRRRVVGTVVVVALTAVGCTVDRDAGLRGQGTGVASVSSTDGAAVLARELRERVRLPPLPSFTIPTDVLTSSTGEDVGRQLDVLPGLYRDIAVLDARCGPAGELAAADVGGRPSADDARGSVDDGAVRVTVGGDGTGVYDAPGVSVAVLGDGTGVYEDERVRLTVQTGGAGTYVDGERRSFVRADGSGSFRDATSRLWVEPDGSGGYDGPEGRVTVDARGRASGEAEPALQEAVTAVVQEGLPRFPAVPLIRRVDSLGERCGTVVRLDAGVLFSVDSTELRSDAEALLIRVAGLLGRLEHPAAQVVGHTDSTGDRTHNQALSERRARAVVDELVDNGVPSASLQAVGRGEDAPVVPDEGDVAAQRFNRRVEIVLRD